MSYTSLIKTRDITTKQYSNEQQPQVSISDYLAKHPNKKLLYNPLAAEFGITNMVQMNDFIKNQMPKFKMVR